MAGCHNAKKPARRVELSTREKFVFASAEFLCVFQTVAEGPLHLASSHRKDYKGEDMAQTLIHCSLTDTHAVVGD